MALPVIMIVVGLILILVAKDRKETVLDKSIELKDDEAASKKDFIKDFDGNFNALYFDNYYKDDLNYVL